MDFVTSSLALLRAFLGLLLIFFIPGYAFTWVVYTRKEELPFIVRIALSCVLSIAIAILSALVLDFILGVETTGLNIAVMLLVLTFYFIILYAARVVLNIHGHIVPQKFSAGYVKLQKVFSRIINSNRDQYSKTAMTRVVYHENIMSGRNHVDHSYLIDVGEEIDIQQVDENISKNSDGGLILPPYPRTRYFELVVREYKEDGLSLVDDLQIYPILVTRKPDITILGHRIKRGAVKLIDRIYKKTDTAEIQWIYSHDFHLFPILYSEDTLSQMVDRVLLKLDEIATSIKRGSRISSHVEETQKLKDEFETVLEKTRKIPTISEVSSHQQSRFSAHPAEDDRRKLQADIVRNLDVQSIKSDTFRRPDKMIKTVKIPDKTDLDKLKSKIKEMEDEDWLFE